MKVFKGILHGVAKVAIKILKKVDPKELENFKAEFAMMRYIQEFQQLSFQ